MSPCTQRRICHDFSTCEPSTVDKRYVHIEVYKDQLECLDTQGTSYNQQLKVHSIRFKVNFIAKTPTIIQSMHDSHKLGYCSNKESLIHGIPNKACRSFLSMSVRLRSSDQDSKELNLNFLAVMSFSITRMNT